MKTEELRMIRNFFLIALLVITGIVFSACTVQWAFKNRNTDCGFTHDTVQPNGKKDPMIFYGNPKSSEKK